MEMIALVPARYFNSDFRTCPVQGSRPPRGGKGGLRNLQGTPGDDAPPGFPGSDAPAGFPGGDAPAGFPGGDLPEGFGDVEQNTVLPGAIPVGGGIGGPILNLLIPEHLSS